MSSGRKRVPLICPSCGANQDADVDVCFACGRLISALTQGHVLASRYEIQNLLGKGGMGVVYKAHDRLLDEPVAIKVLRGDLMGTSELARRFRSEIKLARKVSHNNVCRIHEYGEDGPLSWISMALIEGTDLRKVLRRHQDGLPADEAFEAAIQASDGLQAIHSVGIIHRDLKTPNIVRDALGVVRLMDFGIAKEADRNAGFTATGEVMGTPEYMSPEQCRGEKLDFRSDVYSMGIVIYELFTGRVPFHGETVMSTLLQQLQEPPPLDGPVAERLPPGLTQVLRRALAKQPADRYQSAAELAEALRVARRGLTPVEARSVSAPAAEPAEQPPTISLAEPAPTAPSADSGPLDPGTEKRRDSRLAITVDLVLVRFESDGTSGPEERTLADNIGRRGARVLTADDRAAVGDRVRIVERGGDFETGATVRHVSVGADGIRRLGVEFIDRVAPDRLLPNPEARPRPRRQTRPDASRLPETPIALKTVRDGPERRRDTRLGISFDLLLRRVGPSGTTVEEERTIADNVGRLGARVMTTMGGLNIGEVVSIEEIGGPFRTRAVVRNMHVGTDRIRKVGLEFLDREAPANLVPSHPAARTPPATPATPSTPVAPTTPVRMPSPATPVPASTLSSPRAKASPGPVTRDEVLAALERARSRSHFEVLGVPQTANEAEVKEAANRLTRRFHPDVPFDADVTDLKRQMEAIFIRVNEAYDVLRDPQRRERHERMLGFSPGGGSAFARSAPKEERRGPSPPGPQPPTPDPESDAILAESMLKEARGLLAQERNWDAVQKLENALGLAPGTRVNHAIRVLLAQAIAKNPNWQKRAEEMLLSVIQENPKLADAHLELGTLYKRAGLKARAAAQFRQVLRLRPADAQAAAELKALA
jgi:serine/threonine protein kinase